MDMLLYQAIKALDPANYSEHYAAITELNAPSLITLMDVTGKGFLEQALLVISVGAALTTIPELIIKIDGVTVYDVGMALGTTTKISADGIYMASAATITNTNFMIAGGEYIGSNGINANVATNPAGLIYPVSTQQILALDSQFPVGLDSPIYFSQSLLVQAKGVSSVSEKLKAGAKARY